MADSKDSLEEKVLAAAFRGEAPKQSEPSQSELPALDESKDDSLKQQVLSAAFKNQTPSEPSQPLLGSTGNTLSGGGQFMAPQQAPLVGSGALGSGQFSPVSIGAESRFDKYAGVTDPDTRKGIIESVFKDITDPRDLKEIKEKVPWYNISQNPLQTESLFLHEWNESTGVFDTVKGVAKAGMGMLESLPPLVGGAGRLAKDALTGAVYAGSPEAFGKGATLTDEQKKGMTAQQIQEAELSPRDKAIRAARVPADALLMAREDLLNATKHFSEGKAMLWDKARVGFAGATANLGDPSVTPAVSIEEENARREAAVAPAMAEARRNFATRLNAKHIEHMQKEKNPAVLSRTVDELWQDPAIRKYWIDVVEKLMPPAEDAAPGFGGDIEAARANRRAQASEAANAGVQAMITEANRLKEDPEQVGAVAMTTPLNVFGLGGAVVRDFGMLGSRIGRGLRAAGMTQEAKNAMYAADSAALQAQRAATAKISEQPGLLEKPLGNIADTIDRSKAAFENIPKSVKYAASTLIGAGAGALASDDPLIGALEGAGAGAGIQLGGKALLATPRLGQQLLKAGRMSGAEMGRFEALGKMESASPEVQRFLKWSQKAGGGKALDFIEKNANVFVQHNVSMLPMMVALGVLEDKDAQELAKMWAEFATYGFIHGQVLGGLLGNDPVRMKMDRDAEMRQAQRVLLGFSPESRETVTNLNWDKVIQQSEKRLDRAQKAYFAEMGRGANTPETAKAKAAYEFAHQLHRENLVAPPEARQAFEDGIKLSLGKVSNLINGVLTPNSNMNIELLTSSQIIDKMIAANPNFNGVGAPMTVEQALKKNPTADGIMIGKGTAEDGFTMDPAKDTVFVNVENALKKAELSGEAISNVLAHEVAGHGLFGNDDYRKRIAPLFNKMFGTEAVDENGNVQQITPAEPGMSRDDLFGKFYTKYLEGKTPEQVQSYAEATGVWDKAANDFDKNKIVQLMREETLAEAHAGRFFGDPESPLQQGINWIASRVSSENVKSALNHLYAIAGPAVYKQWTSGKVGVTYSPEVMRAIRNVEREMKKYDGDFTDAEQGEAVAAPITRKDVIKSPEMLNKYFKDTGKFETTPVAVVTDADGKVVQTVDLKDNDAPEGSWVYHQDDATGDVVPNKEKGYGELHPELIQIQVPVGGRITVERKIAYDESTGKPKERKNKETAEFIKTRNQVLRDAIDNAGDPSEIGRFKAIPSKGEGEEEGEMRYTGKMTKEQRAAIAALPESIVAASTKDLLFQYDDLLTRDDGTVLDIDYAARLNAKGNYEAFVSRVRQIVPLRLHLSKDGHFYVKAWDLSALRKKVQLYKNYAPGVFEPWGGDVDAFWKEFRTKLLPKLSEKPDIEKIRADIAEGVDPSTFQGPAKEQFDQKVAEAYAKKLNEPAWTALEGDPETQRLKRTIYAKMIGDPNPNVPDVESIPDIPKNKLSRAERKIDKKSPLAQIIKSYRLDAHTAAEENAATHLKYPIPYKARFMPEQAQTTEEQRPAFGGGILKGLQAVSAKYDPKGTGEVKATVQPAEAQVRFMPEKKEREQWESAIEAARETANKELNRLRSERVNTSDVLFEHQPSDDPEFGDNWKFVPPKDKYIDNTSMYDVYESGGKYYVGEGYGGGFASLNEAKEEATQRAMGELWKGSRSTFDADTDAQRAVGEIFDSFPKKIGDVTTGDGWFTTKWGSWYLEGKIPAAKGDDYDTFKLSIRDHDSGTRFQKPDKSFFVSKEWTPDETAEALKKAADWIANEAQFDAPESGQIESSQTRFMPNVAVVPERFTGTAEEERRGKYVEPPKFFNKFNISQYEKGGKFFDAETGEDLTDKSYENASIAVINGKPSLVANNESETAGNGPLFKTNLFKQKAGWKWVSEGAPDTSTIVSVEGQGKHLYALQADFQNGVTMARYPDKASEPRLRPTGRGELTMGEQIGTIDIRGKQHLVYDKVTIGQAPESAQIRFMPEQLAVDEQTQQTRINEPGRRTEDIGVRPDETRNRGGQRTARGYSPLAGAPNVFGRSGPVEKISDIADRYAESRGIAVRKQAAYVKADVERGRRIAEEYANMPHDPQNPRVQEAYADLIRQSADQYKALTEDGYKAWFVDPANDPYEGKPWRAMRDLRENESMGVFPTEAGFGSGDTKLDVADNPLLGDSGLKWPYGSPDGPLRRVLWNDVFRYIHDAFGHGIEGAGFREDGEENAWQAHVRLFDGPAVGAMTSETRGQNSWLNFGPHAEKNKTASVEETIFADQKTGLMPEWTSNEGVAPDEPLLERGTLSGVPKPFEGAQMRFIPLSNEAQAELSLDEREQYNRLNPKKVIVAQMSKPDTEHDSLRVGTALLGTEANPVETPQTSNISGAIVPDKLLAAQLEKMDYPHLPDSILNEANPKMKRDKMVEFMKQNLKALYDAFPEEYRARATQWYDGARRLADELSAQHADITPEQAAGILAVFSPQKDWFMNVAQGYQCADVYKNEQNTVITPKLAKKEIEGIINAAQAPVKQKIKAPKGKTETERQKTIRKNKNKALDQAAKDKRRKVLEQLYDKKLSDLSDGTKEGDVLEAWGIRVLAQIKFGRRYKNIAPEGDLLGNARNKKGDKELTNTWGSTGEIRKAVSIMKDGNLKNISDKLGDEHKVRNFYNNIIAPNTPFGDATIDTHAVAAAHLMPYGSSADAVSDNFGGAGKSAPLGISGSYHIYMDAYQQLAKELGILPRQLQSITWEAIRELYPSEVRSPKAVKEAVQIWKQNNENDARQYILRNGVSAPVWARATNN